MSRSFGEISVADVVGKAGVGRSTFYEHFRSKTDLLSQSFETPFAPLADLLSGTRSARAAIDFLAHVASHRQMVRRLIEGALLRRTQDVLAKMIDQRIAGRPGMGSAARRAIVAAQLSGGAIAAICTWMDRGCELEAAELASYLESVATSILGGGN
jgi:AcrR family transcriptional regulator